MKTVRYSEIRDSLRTGDLVFFSGTGLVSTVIKIVTGSPWSHIGMIYRDEQMDMLHIVESTMLNPESGIEGVQCHPLSIRIAQYDGKVAIRRAGPDAPRFDMRKFGAWRKEMDGRPYEKRLISQLAFSAIDFVELQDEEDMSSVFCSELIANCWQDQGRMNKDIVPSEWTPADFAGEDLGFHSNVELYEMTEVRV